MNRGLVDDLNADYSHALDAEQFERWPGFFTADAVYKVISDENHRLGYPIAAIYCDGGAMLRDRVRAIRETAVHEPRRYRRLVGRAHLTNPTAEACDSETAFAVFESVVEREPRVLFVGRYLDRVALTPDGPRYARRLAVYDNWRVYNSLIYPL